MRMIYFMNHFLYNDKIITIAVIDGKTLGKKTFELKKIYWVYSIDGKFIWDVGTIMFFNKEHINNIGSHVFICGQPEPEYEKEAIKTIFKGVK